MDCMNVLPLFNIYMLYPKISITTMDETSPSINNGPILRAHLLGPLIPWPVKCHFCVIKVIGNSYTFPSSSSDSVSCSRDLLYLHPMSLLHQRKDIIIIWDSSSIFSTLAANRWMPSVREHHFWLFILCLIRFQLCVNQWRATLLFDLIQLSCWQGGWEKTPASMLINGVWLKPHFSCFGSPYLSIANTETGH